MTGIIFAILCALFLGLAMALLRKSYKEMSPSVGFLFDSIFGLLIWVPLAIFMGISKGVNYGQALFFAMVSAILAEALVFYALSRGKLAVTATVLSTYSVYTVIFSRLLNKEFLSIQIYFFVILTIFGSVIASLPERNTWSKLKLNKSILWPFIAAVGIGLSDSLSKGYINRSNDFSFLFMLGFIQIPVALAYLKIEKESFFKSINGVLKKFKDYKFAMLGGLFNIVGTGFLWLSFSYAPASIASPITGCNGAITVLLSRFLLKEKISRIKYLGIILAFAGIIGIAISKEN
jgi:drug/metabolite transporter (DMT)-like permease